MHEAHGCAPTRKTWGAKGVCGPWEAHTKLVSCNAIVTCVLPDLCVFLRFFAQYSMNLYLYATGFGRCPFECSAGPCRRLTGFGTTYGQSCRPVWSKYRTCRTHRYGRCLDHARINLYGPKIDGNPSLKAEHVHLSPMAIRPRTGPTIIEKSYKVKR